MQAHELELKVHGRVQGVRFRQMSARKASSLGLVGYVMNRADGSVDIVVHGSKEHLFTFLHWIESSPGLSSVSGVQYQWHKPTRTFTDFKVVKNSSFMVDQAKSFWHLSKSVLKRGARSVPNHIAIIPDGNRRWARTRGQEPQFGHYTSASFQHLQELFSTARSAGVHYITLWGFSTENWKRAAAEREALFALLQHGVERLLSEASIHKMRFRHVGRKDRLPRSLLDSLQKLETATEAYDGFTVQLCLDYGGSDELVRAVNKLIDEGAHDIDEATLYRALDSADVPPVDMIIRTSGEQRVSGFMPLQAAYAELYFSSVHFPDFDARALNEALVAYNSRQRRFGN